MSEKLWSPTHETVGNSLLSQFTNEVTDQGAGSFDDYDALHQWSVENPADFWAAYWDFTEPVSYTHLTLPTTPYV